MICGDCVEVLKDVKCKLFGDCGGCEYRDKTYEEELAIKNEWLTDLYGLKLRLSGEVFEKVVQSPRYDFYRNRIDLTLKRVKGEWRLGYVSPKNRFLLEVEKCPIAREEINAFIPGLKEKALQILPEKYRNANIVVRTDDEGKVSWGGIGRHSLRMQEENYFWTEVCGKKIFYSLDTFFQANLHILDDLMAKIKELVSLEGQNVFYDLYSGVGLFGIALSDYFERTVMIEESATSVEIAKYNKAYHGLEGTVVYEGKVENVLPLLLEKDSGKQTIAMIDPPRKGLHESAANLLCTQTELSELLYLSCNPETQVRDLEILQAGGWEIEKVVPFDFFPRTKHLEVLVKLKRSKTEDRPETE